eukprot:365228-Chlamydomonas_euryale.AAC.35
MASYRANTCLQPPNKYNYQKWCGQGFVEENALHHGWLKVACMARVAASGKMSKREGGALVGALPCQTLCAFESNGANVAAGSDTASAQALGDGLGAAGGGSSGAGGSSGLLCRAGKTRRSSQLLGPGAVTSRMKESAAGSHGDALSAEGVVQTTSPLSCRRRSSGLPLHAALQHVVVPAAVAMSSATANQGSGADGGSGGAGAAAGGAPLSPTVSKSRSANHIYRQVMRKSSLLAVSMRSASGRSVPAG